jgi:hypothetical protein
VIFCKVHSYLLTNCEFRDKYLREKEIAAGKKIKRQEQLDENDNVINIQRYPENVREFKHIFEITF